MATWPTQKTGMKGEDVRTVQYLLNAHGASLTVDGDFGSATKAAVESFQGSHGLGVDGIVGNGTWPKLIVTVDAGDNGDAVRAVQSQVNSRIPKLLTVDGAFGAQTTAAVKDFQNPTGLTVDGIVGTQTWNRLVNGYLTAKNAGEAAEDVFAAWTKDDAAAAAKHATKAAVDALFAETWTPDTWTPAGSQGAAGTVFVTWDKKGGGQLVLGVNNNTGAPFYWVKEADFS
jgi:Putative peptidoglycan binding domain